MLFSYYEYAKSINSELTVIWIKTEACPGYFLDYFEPIPNVHFTHQIPKNADVNYRGCYVRSGFNPNYKHLKLKADLEKIIHEKMSELNINYISLHIRRTDHVWVAKRRKCFTDDAEFEKFIQDSDPNKYIYIATDNAETYDKFKKNILIE